MTRFATLAAAALLATPLAAQDKDTMCAKTAEIVGDAVSARADGAAPEAAVRDVTGAIDTADETYKAAVQPIVDWVYTLPEAQLTDEVAVAYEEQCLAQ